MKTIKVNNPRNKHEQIAECGDGFVIEGKFDKWLKKHFVEEVKIKLKKRDNEKYNIFHANFCPNDKLFEIHVALVKQGQDLNYTYEVENPGVDFSIKPNSNEEVNLKVWLYKRRIENGTEFDKYLIKCGVHTNVEVPEYDKTITIEKMGDPIPSNPETVGENVIVGGD